MDSILPEKDHKILLQALNNVKCLDYLYSDADTHVKVQAPHSIDSSRINNLHKSVFCTLRNVQPTCKETYAKTRRRIKLARFVSSRIRKGLEQKNAEFCAKYNACSLEITSHAVILMER